MISKFISPNTVEQMEEKCRLESYFIYLDYLRGRSLDAQTNRVNPPFSDSEKNDLQEIEFYLSPAARIIIHASSN